jgi:uroporphyrinogen-III synthase
MQSDTFRSPYLSLICIINDLLSYRRNVDSHCYIFFASERAVRLAVNIFKLFCSRNKYIFSFPLEDKSVRRCELQVRPLN